MRKRLFEYLAPVCAIVSVLGASVASPAQMAFAAEPQGQCYTLVSSPTDANGIWQGPVTASMNRCAGLAGVQTKTAQDGLAKGRWQDIEFEASAEGWYASLADPQTSHHFWDATKLIDFVANDVDAFWQREFEARGWRYVSLQTVQGYTSQQRLRTACGRAVPNNAFYCGQSHSIYYDVNLATRQFNSIGDFAPAAIIAHEWGHAIQALRNLDEGADYTIQMELQADCFAGAYARDAQARGILDEGDTTEASDFLFKVGDRSGTAWFRRGAHGTPKQRSQSFNNGLNGGVDACLALPQLPQR